MALLQSIFPALSLYNKYRPKDWDSVIGQEYITTILRNSLTTGRVHHAYLFHGSRGTGKTTSARILAKALNCTNLQKGNPCHKCANCLAFDTDTLLDIIEIDGASNNGVENVRELIERARFEPNQGTYKIYIIDEVHMLSTGAFNALLKTLEQPPKHVKFILATTEIDKVPETVRSRTLRFDFRKIGIEDLVNRMKYVCQEENVIFQEEALQIIAKAARGGFRDALTLLEQNIMDGEVSTEHVRYTLALVEDSMIDACIEALEHEQVSTIQVLLETLKEKHIEARSFFEQLMYRLRDHMITHLDDPRFYIYSEILNMLESAYGRIRSIPDGMMLIEITLLRIVRRGGNTEQRTAPPTIPTKKKEEFTHPKETPVTPAQKIPEQKIETPKAEIKEEKIHGSTGSTIPKEQEPKIGSTTFSYPALINHLKTTEPAMTMDLKSARFQVDGTTLILSFNKKWNYDRVNNSEKKNVISEKISALFGEVWKIECKLVEGSEGLKDAVHEVF